MHKQLSLLPRFWQSFQYSSLPSTDATAGVVTILKPNVFAIVKSKRVRITCGFILLATIFLFFLPAQYRTPSSWREISNAITHPGSKPSALSTDWSRFAYTQYVTNTAYLCNSVMLFEILHRLGTQADRLMMYPADFSIEDGVNTPQAMLIRKARDEYSVKLQPIQVEKRESDERKNLSRLLPLQKQVTNNQ
jgi:hypothetical protein